MPEIAGKVLAMLDEMESIADADEFPEAPVPPRPAAVRVCNDLPTGTAMGRFVITGFLGQGGMGKVYSAHDPDLDREIALKVIAQTASAAGSEGFIREAQAASALNHPNIVTVYEVIHSEFHAGDCHGTRDRDLPAALLRHSATNRKIGYLGTADRQRPCRGPRGRHCSSGYQTGQHDAPARRIR